MWVLTKHVLTKQYVIKNHEKDPLMRIRISTFNTISKKNIHWNELGEHKKPFQHSTDMNMSEAQNIYDEQKTILLSLPTPCVAKMPTHIKS